MAEAEAAEVVSIKDEAGELEGPSGSNVHWFLLAPQSKREGPFTTGELRGRVLGSSSPNELRVRESTRSTWTSWVNAWSEYPQLVEAGVVAAPRSRRGVAPGHLQYKRFLSIAGPEFSPLFPLKEPFELGGHPFWTVEGIWQGTKVIRLERSPLVGIDEVPYELLSEGSAGLAIWFPDAGLTREDFIRSSYFKLLKSSRKYDRHRNRAFGVHWRFDGHHDPRDGQRLSGDDAKARLHRPFFAAQLRCYPEAITRLRRLIDGGRVTITDEMVQAHGHLRAVQR